MDESDGIPNASEPTRDDTNVRFAESELEPGDVLEVGIFELLRAEDEYRVRRVVNEVGYIGSIPEVGTVKVTGLTPRGLELEIAARLQKNGKLVDPQISVSVLESQAKRYTILGSIGRPGTYAIPRPNFRMIDAIGDAGGLPPEIKTVYVIRTNGPKPQMSKDADALYQPGTPGMDPKAPSEPPPLPPIEPGNEAFKLSDAPGSHGQLARAGMMRRVGSRDNPGTSALFTTAGSRAGQVNPTTASTPDADASTAPAATSKVAGSAPSTGGAATPQSKVTTGRPTPPASGIAVQTPADPDIPDIQPLLPPPATRQPEPTIEEMNELPSTAAPSRPWAYDSARGWYEVKSAPVNGQGGTTAMPGPITTPPPSGAATSSAASQGGVDWSQVVDNETTTRVIAIPTEPLLNGDVRYNIVVRPNDIVNVAPGPIGEFYVMGNVLRPGAYSMTGRDVDVRAAIAAAGGFGPLATPSRAELIRRGSGDQEEIRSIDLDAIFAGRSDNFYMKPNDILNVGTNALMPFIATVRNAFRVSYGFGFVYDRNFADIDSFSPQNNPDDRRRIERQQQGFPFP